MLLCDKCCTCLVVVSRGVCEGCGRYADCADCQHPKHPIVKAVGKAETIRAIAAMTAQKRREECMDNLVAARVAVMEAADTFAIAMASGGETRRERNDVIDALEVFEREVRRAEARTETSTGRPGQ